MENGKGLIDSFTKMKIVLHILLWSTLSLQSFGQLYNARKGDRFQRSFFVEIKNDSAYVEVFHISYPDFYYKICEKHLPRILNRKDTVYGDDKMEVTLRKKRCSVSYKVSLFYKTKNESKTNRVKLELQESDNRELYRRYTYYTEKRRIIGELKDSLEGPNSSFDGSSRFYIDRNSWTDNTSWKEFKVNIDKTSDSVIANTIKHQDPIVHRYYHAADSLAHKDTLIVYRLLDSANYKYHYSEYLLHKLALNKPEWLISYVDSRPDNKAILKAIKNHNSFREIVERVKETELAGKNKKKIVKQKRKRITQDIAMETLAVTIVLAELSILVLVGILIF